MKHDITIPLTSEQLREFRPFLERLCEIAEKDPEKLGSVFAQIVLGDTHGTIRAKFLNYEKTRELKDALNEIEPPESSDGLGGG